MRLSKIKENMMDKEFSLPEICRTVRDMRARVDAAQGRTPDPMCRLSLPMSEWLISYINEIELRGGGDKDDKNTI